ncbi:MAG: hypothetical protein H6539_03145 [Bacteroidales bacterium]|nr:hypothetical protein [Bacteroidales bacterium]
MRKNISILSIVLLGILSACSSGPVKNGVRENKMPVLYPDYTSLEIPVNIAPLNFIIQEDARKFNVTFSGKGKQSFTVSSWSGKISIPIRKWKELLNENTGDSISIDIAARKDNQWIIYPTIKNFVSADSIDPYIVYRRINPALVLWNDMAIVQRSTETFDESAILENRNTNGNCMHCHTFQNHNPKNMLLHLRTPPGGTFIKSNDSVRWLETKTPNTIASFAYPSWHPTKPYIAFSTNIIHQLMYSSGDRLNYVYDDKSDIMIYDIDKNLVFTSPKIASEDLENLPNWSADGKYLYYINCPAERKKELGKLVKYDLMRISFDADTHQWGKPEVLLSADTTGLSITFPEASPDGRFIVFCMADYGYFTIGNNSSDLYIMDLKDMSYRKLNVNSDQTESFHNWSLNSRWIVFASKREDGIITLPYFSHIDANGKESRPFVLPAKDPESLITRFYNYNRPVFISGKVTIPQDEILYDISRPTQKVIFDTLNVAMDSLFGNKSLPNQDESSMYKKK